MDDIDDDEGSYDEESEQDLDSELGDTLDVNDLNRDTKDAASEEGKRDPKRPKVQTAHLNSEHSEDEDEPS